MTPEETKILTIQTENRVAEAVALRIRCNAAKLVLERAHQEYRSNPEPGMRTDLAAFIDELTKFAHWARREQDYLMWKLRKIQAGEWRGDTQEQETGFIQRGEELRNGGPHD